MTPDTTLPAASPAVRAAMRIALRNGCALSREAAEQIAEAVLGCAGEGLRAALRSITSRITTSAMDFSDYEPNAWVYGIAVGWDCDEDHDHDDICGGTGAMEELAARFGWDEAAVARLRDLRKAYAAATGGSQ